jgi:hypothetical protein
MTRQNETPQPVTDGSDLVWQGDTYARVPPGIYQAVCTGWQGPQWVRAYHRWSIRLNFSLLGCEADVSRFLNLGSDPKRKSFGRRSSFYKAWSQANGETPRKGQRLTCATFTEPGLLYTVRVADAVRGETQQEKPDVLVYSKVTEILRVERP